ncbi:hypothetical protein [Spiroplasma endosymbiont of Aspidapion aeneum]|uniref:hypothetical protein n=1 Tax=Spiroplasma endosymbiont of Aspidapion aeneum TaxID=3066276 RepID=UPI00313BBA67
MINSFFARLLAIKTMTIFYLLILIGLYFIIATSKTNYWDSYIYVNDYGTGLFYLIIYDLFFGSLCTLLSCALYKKGSIIFPMIFTIFLCFFPLINMIIAAKVNQEDGNVNGSVFSDFVNNSLTNEQISDLHDLFDANLVNKQNSPLKFNGNEDNYRNKILALLHEDEYYLE